MSQSPGLPLSHEELSAISRRLKAATPGPWRHREGFIETCTEPSQLLGVTMQRSEQGLDALPGPANAEFLAHARTDIPRLLAEIERLHAALGQQFPRRDVTLAGSVPASESR